MDRENVIDRQAVPEYGTQMRLDGKVYAVIGAGRGIGRQSAHALSQSGATIICVDAQGECGRAVADELNASAIITDMTDDKAVSDTFAAIVREHGRLDGIVDIVGGSVGAGLLDVDAELVRLNFDLNLYQAMSVTRHGARQMAITGGGTIVLVGSVSGISSLPNQTVYGTAKAALHHFVRCAAAELGHLGIRINAVAPGYVRTERMNARFPAESWEEIAGNTPLQRGGETSDIAGPILFLSQPLSGFVTGQVLVADGGLLVPLRAMGAATSRQLAGKFV